MEKASEGELAIMRVIWSLPESRVLFSQIQDGLREAGYAHDKNTLTVLLSRLRRKGYLTAEKDGRCNLYTALIREQEYQNEKTQTLIEEAYQGRPWGLVANLVESDRLSQEELEELQELLARRTQDR